MSNPDLAVDLDRAPGVADAARLAVRARSVLAFGEVMTRIRPLLFEEEGAYPLFVEAADGCRLVDTAGRTYVDWLGGFGAALGYRRPEIVEAVRKQLGEAAPTLSIPHRLEVEVAEQLVDLVPTAEMVLYGKNGSDAVTGAVRLARAVTGRDVILQFGYHGFHDWFAELESGCLGIPAAGKGLVHPFPYDDLPALERLFDEHRGKVAAVVMEPFRYELPSPGYLRGVKELCRRHGALLAYDEIVTGFRSHRSGAQQLLGVLPDLSCFGKALSNGFPLSVLVGPRELMRHAHSVGVDMACRGETVALAAAKAALAIHAREPVAETIASIGRRVASEIEAEAARRGVALRVTGHPCRLQLAFAPAGGRRSDELLGLFVQECLKRGVALNGSLLPSTAHDDDAVRTTLDAAAEALERVARLVAGDTATLPAPFGPSTRGFVDTVLRSEGALRIAGWILPSGSGADRIEAIPEEGEVSRARLAPRPDVAAVCPGAAGLDRAGFSLDLPLRGVPLEGWALRAWRGDRVVWRGRLVSDPRPGEPFVPVALGEGDVVSV